MSIMKTNQDEKVIIIVCAFIAAFVIPFVCMFMYSMYNSMTQYDNGPIKKEVNAYGCTKYHTKYDAYYICPDNVGNQEIKRFVEVEPCYGTPSRNCTYVIPVLSEHPVVNKKQDHVE